MTRSHWTWETASPRERADAVREHHRLGCSDDELCRIFNLTQNGAAGEPMSAEEAREFMLSVLSGSQRKIIAAMGGTTEALSREEVGARTEYSPSSGGFNNLIGSLCTLGILTKPAQGHVALSDWAAELLT